MKHKKYVHISKPTLQEYKNLIDIANAESERAEKDAANLQRKDAYYEELRKTLIQKDQDIKEQESYADGLKKDLQQERLMCQKAESKLQPMQEIIKEKDAVKCEVSDMKNGLLARIEEINSLQNDNEYLRKQVEELSHDSLVEKTKEVTTQLEDAKQYVKVLEAQKNKDIGELNIEINHLEALNEKKDREKAEISSKIRSFLRDAKQFIPTYQEAEANLLQGKPNTAPDAIAFQVATYLGNMRKLIENLEGYLNTVAT